VLGSLASGSPMPAASAPQPSRPAVRAARQPEARPPESRPVAPEPSRPAEQAQSDAAQPARLVGSSPDMAHFLSAVQRDNVPLYGSLEHASGISLTPGRLTIRFPESEGSHSRLAGGEFNLQFLRDLAASFTGVPCQIDIVKEQDQRQEPVTDPVQDPKVQGFLEKFPGKIMIERKAGG